MMDNAQDKFTTMRNSYFKRRIRSNWILTAIAIIVFFISLLLYSTVTFNLMRRTFVVSTNTLIPSLVYNSSPSVEWTTPFIRRELASFIENLRSIPADRYVLKKNIEWVLSHVPSSSPSWNAVNGFIRNKSSSPAILQKKYIRRVSVKTVNHQGGNTWLVEWEEMIFPRDNPQNKKTTIYGGQFELANATSLDLDTIAKNPMGLSVRQYNFKPIGKD